MNIYIYTLCIYVILTWVYLFCMCGAQDCKMSLDVTVAFCVSHGLSYKLVPDSNHTQVIVLVPHSAAPQARPESPRLSSTPLTRFWVVLGAANPEHIGIWGAASRSDWHALRAGIKPARGTRAFDGRESAVMHWRANGGEDDPEHPAIGKFFVWPRDGPEQ